MATSEGGVEMQSLLNMVARRDNITANIRFLAEDFTWQQLCRAGLKVEAMVRYRAENDSCLSEAHTEVTKYIDQLEHGVVA